MIGALKNISTKKGESCWRQEWGQLFRQGAKGTFSEEVASEKRLEQPRVGGLGKTR